MVEDLGLRVERLQWKVNCLHGGLIAVPRSTQLGAGRSKTF